MNKSVLKTWLPMLVLASSLGFSTQSWCCSVPVFRYALERWDRDEYRLVVASKGKLPPEEQKWVQDLAQETDQQNGFCNLRVFTLDTTDTDNKRVLDEYPGFGKVSTPTAFLLYPYGSSLTNIIHQEPFAEATVKKLTSSPFIDEISNEILRGMSVVWVLVDSTNPAANDEAYKALSKSLAVLPEQIELPPGIIETSGNVTGLATNQDEATVAAMAYYDQENVLHSGIPFKIAFAVKRLPRSKDESMLRTILMDSGDNLDKQQNEPMAFPVFGRGRFLPPLVGDDINTDNVAMATSYLCGNCSCQVKAGNPGVDLLSHIDWYSYLAGSKVVKDRGLPPLSGTGDLVATNAAPEHTAARPVENPAEQPTGGPTAPPSASPLKRNVAFAVGGILCLVAGASLVVLKRKRG